MHTQWRDCQEWKHERLPLSTTSNEAAKLYDASLTQYAGFYDDETLGGLPSTLRRIFEADPDFVMGRVISNGLQLISSARSPRLDADFHRDLDDMCEMAVSQRAGGLLSEREALHAEALGLAGKGKNKKACDIWRLILADHPTDMLAIKFLQDRCVFMGDSKFIMKDSMAQVLPMWTPTLPLYPYILSLYSFTLCETEDFVRSEKFARKSLELNPRDSWASHAIAHCMEMTGRPDDGIDFLRDTVSDWEQSTSIKFHLSWHKALFHIEKGEYAEAFEQFDEEVEKAFLKNNGNMYCLLDACSLLYRLQLEGVDVARRWDNIYDVCSMNLKEHIHMLPFADIHLCMAYACGAPGGDTSRSQEFIDSLRDFVFSAADPTIAPTDNKHFATSLAVCEAITAYAVGDYVDAVEALLPHEWDLVNLGGSDAQRDVLEQLLIHAAVKSGYPEHGKTARRLLAARKAKRVNSELTDRLVAAKLASQHNDIPGIF